MPWYIWPSVFAGFAGPFALALVAWQTRKLSGERAIGLGASVWVLWWTGYFLFLMGGVVEWPRTGEMLLLATTVLALSGGLAGLTAALLNVTPWMRRMRRLLYGIAGVLTLMMMYVSLLSAVHFFVTPVVAAIFLALALMPTRKGQTDRALSFQ